MHRRKKTGYTAILAMLGVAVAGAVFFIALYINAVKTRDSEIDRDFQQSQIDREKTIKTAESVPNGMSLWDLPDPGAQYHVTRYLLGRRYCDIWLLVNGTERWFRVPRSYLKIKTVKDDRLSGGWIRTSCDNRGFKYYTFCRLQHG